MSQKKILGIIGTVLCFLVFLKLRAGFYSRELPLYGGLLIIGIICLIVAQKMKVVRDNTDKNSPTLSEKWKCNCGSYNNQSDLFCQNCGAKKISS